MGEMFCVVDDFGTLLSADRKCFYSLRDFLADVSSAFVPVAPDEESSSGLSGADELVAVADGGGRLPRLARAASSALMSAAMRQAACDQA
jgi:hypothetical protein